MKQVLARLKAEGKSPSAFICESLQGVAGQIIMPDVVKNQNHNIKKTAGWKGEITKKYGMPFERFTWQYTQTSISGSPDKIQFLAGQNKTEK